MVNVDPTGYSSGLCLYQRAGTIASEQHFRKCILCWRWWWHDSVFYTEQINTQQHFTCGDQNVIDLRLEYFFRLVSFFTFGGIFWQLGAKEAMIPIKKKRMILKQIIIFFSSLYIKMQSRSTVKDFQYKWVPRCLILQISQPTKPGG